MEPRVCIEYINGKLELWVLVNGREYALRDEALRMVLRLLIMRLAAKLGYFRRDAGIRVRHRAYARYDEDRIESVLMLVEKQSREPIFVLEASVVDDYFLEESRKSLCFSVDQTAAEVLVEKYGMISQENVATSTTTQA